MLVNFTLPFTSLWDNKSGTQTVLNTIFPCFYQSAGKMHTAALLMEAMFKFLEWTK